MQRGRIFSVLVFLFVALGQLQAQSRAVKIAVFAPLYIDSAFSGETYKLGRNNLPRYMLPGLDFYNGVMLAVDSLQSEKAPVGVMIYDTKSVSYGIESVLSQPAMQDVQLIIASFNSRAEIKPLADFAKEKNILLLSATYPNDGGISNNPGFVMLNPTLGGHIEAVYRFLHRSYPLENITLFRRKGIIEDQVFSTIANMNKRTPGVPLKIKTVELTDSFTAKEVTDHLDSTRRNIVVCGTLNETFGINLSKAIGSNKAYKAIAVGMPTWDALRDISNGLEIVYTTPYNFTRQDKLSIRIIDLYRLKYAGRASDMVFKGYETMYRYTKLLLKYGKDLPMHLSDKEPRLFNDFDIQATSVNKDYSTTDYLENKKLYLIRKLDGKVKSVN